MSKVERQHLLTAGQLAQFVTDGFLILEAVVPPDANKAVYADERQWEGSGHQFWHHAAALQAVFDLPHVKGAVQSFVGVNPVYDHSFLHIVQAGHLAAQEWHADSVIDVRAIFQQSHHDLAVDKMPSFLLPRKGRFGLIDYEKMFCPDPNADDIFELRGVNRETGCMVVVRPDQYVSHILPLDGHEALAGFFARILLDATS